MNNSNTTEIEQVIGNEVDHFVVRASKKNHDAMIQLGKQFADIMRRYGGPNPLYFLLNNTGTPMEGITNIAKIVSANQDEDVWLQLIFYRIVSSVMRFAQRWKTMKVWVQLTNSSWI